MMERKISLSPLELAKITQGVWENLHDDLEIYEIHNIYHYLQEKDMFVVYYDDWNSKTTNNEDKIEGAIKKNISAIMIKKSSNLKPNIPTLKVENTYTALKEIALYSSKISKAKRVLITGSYGKTGFKVQLYHLLKEQIKSYTRLNSANTAVSTYCNLASLKSDTELLLIEQPISALRTTYRRATYVKPNITVLTSIGHEGIDRFKDIKTIIKHKLQMAKALGDGGKLLLPKDDRYFKDILKEAQNYEHIQILTYGHDTSNQAYPLYKNFSNFGWDVVAKIENMVVAYRIPFFEEYAVSVSCGVLLCGYHLGVDVHAMANNYSKNQNFKSSGLLYKVTYKSKHFYLYDQSKRGGIEGYESFFKTLSYIKPKNNGKKIVVTSEFVDYKDGEMQFIDIPKFQNLIEKSQIQTLFSVEKFSEHIQVLKDKSIWKNHSIDWNNLKEEILETIQNDDILSIKGIFESHLVEFIEYLKNLEGIILEPLKQKNSMKEKNNALTNLRTLQIDDRTLFQEAVAKEDKKGFVYYFPFLYFWSLSKNRELLIDTKDDSISLFLLDKFYRSTPPKLQLYLPTLPLLSQTQQKAFERMYEYNHAKKGSIVRVDRADVAKLKAFFPELQFGYKFREYLYNPKIYQNLTGAKFRNLRHQIATFLKNENIEILPYEQKYQQQCLDLYETWMKIQINKYESIEDEKYTKSCILHYDRFEKEDLNGLVVLQNKQVKSFAFVGKIHHNMLCFFIGKSDHSLKGIQSYIKYQLLLTNKQYPLVNDGEGITNGLDASKRMLRPVGFHKIYKAFITKEK